MNGTKQNQPWFEKYPDLYGKQVDILKSAGFELDAKVLLEQRRIQFAGHSKVDPTRQLHVAFPQAFPSSAPKISDTTASRLLARHHRIDSRQFCLFGFNEKRWSAGCSVADALSEAEELISTFKDGTPTLQNEPPEPITRSIIYHPAAILVPPPISTFNGFGKLESMTGTFLLKFVHEGDQKRETRGRGVLLEASFGEKAVKSIKPFSEYFGNIGKKISGDWFYLPTPPTQENLPEVLKGCFQKTKMFKKAEFYWLGLVFNEEVGGSGQVRLTWLIARMNAQGECHLVRTYPFIQKERYARIPGLEGLEEKRVMVVGCGSLGSKIAANLAASGVNRFRLVDCDYFEPGNSVRHELGVEFFGFSKECALHHRLCSLNPAVAENSQCLTFRVGSINSFANEQIFYGLVKDSDLIIDATGLHSVSHFLNNLCHELRIPMLTASVTNGAWSGEIVQIIPGQTPCYLCWLDQYYNDKPPSAPESSGIIFAPGCDQPTFTGTTYDLGFVAGLATSMCVETLLPENGTADYSRNYIRWSGKDKNGKTLFLTERLTTNAHPDCWCRDSLYGV